MLFVVFPADKLVGKHGGPGTVLGLSITCSFPVLVVDTYLTPSCTHASITLRVFEAVEGRQFCDEIHSGRRKVSGSREVRWVCPASMCHSQVRKWLVMDTLDRSDRPVRGGQTIRACLRTSQCARADIEGSKSIHNIGIPHYSF